jgi:hypothetical protein
MSLTIFTINGYMGDMWSGPQADTGRHLSNQGLNLAYWQPIGYDCGRFPLSIGEKSGVAEMATQMQAHPGPFLVSCWSLGAIVWTDVYRKLGTPGWPPLSDFKGATTFGNPYRQAGAWAPHVGGLPYGYTAADPGGAGVGGPRNNMSNTPDTWHDYAHPGDMYTCCPTDETGADIRIIFDFVLTQWTGAVTDLVAFVEQGVSQGVLKSGWHILWAIIDAVTFYGGGTRQHVNYNPGPSMNYLAALAKSAQPTLP